MTHFNQLTPAEDERLALLCEELAESIQAIGKIQRHGYQSRHPDGGPTNRESLEQELGDVRCALRMLCDAGDLNNGAIELAAGRKSVTVKKYLHHQEFVRQKGEQTQDQLEALKTQQPIPLIYVTEEMADAGYDAMRDPKTNSPAPWIVLGTAFKVFEAMLEASKHKEKVMKARIGDYIKTEKGLLLVVKADADNGYELEDGQALADSDITYDDVFLEYDVG